MKVYAIEGAQGSYDNYCTWVLPVAFRTKEEAEGRVPALKDAFECAHKEAQKLRIQGNWVASYNCKSSLDSEANAGEDGIEYTVFEITVED